MAEKADRTVDGTPLRFFGARTFLSALGFDFAEKADRNVRAPNSSFDCSLKNLSCAVYSQMGKIFGLPISLFPGFIDGNCVQSMSIEPAAI
jgi:hypothetical protein